jgi:hypothetical protein
MWGFRLTRMRGVPVQSEAFGFAELVRRQRLDVLACQRVG